MHTVICLITLPYEKSDYLPRLNFINLSIWLTFVKKMNKIFFWALVSKNKRFLNILHFPLFLWFQIKVNSLSFFPLVRWLNWSGFVLICEIISHLLTSFFTTDGKLCVLPTVSYGLDIYIYIHFIPNTKGKYIRYSFDFPTSLFIFYHLHLVGIVFCSNYVLKWFHHL